MRRPWGGALPHRKHHECELVGADALVVALGAGALPHRKHHECELVGADARVGCPRLATEFLSVQNADPAYVEMRALKSPRNAPELEYVGADERVLGCLGNHAQACARNFGAGRGGFEPTSTANVRQRLPETAHICTEIGKVGADGAGYCFTVSSTPYPIGTVTLVAPAWDCTCLTNGSSSSL